MPVRSLNSSVLKWPDGETVEAALRTWIAEQARHHPELRRAGYFGSYARGDWGVGSDVDLVVVVGDTHTPYERRGTSWPRERLPVPAELLVYTENEWKALQARNDRFAESIMRETVWFYPQ